MHMTKRYFFTLPLLLLLCPGAATGLWSCSDNVEQGLHPGHGTRIDISVSDNGVPMPNNLLSVGSGLSRTPLEVDANTRWTVEVSDCPGSWCSVSFDTPDGITTGAGTFTLETSANRSESEQRTCTVTVYALDMDGERVPGVSYTFTVRQENRKILVSNPTPAPWGAIGGEDSFSVTSNLPWSVKLSDPEDEGGYMTVVPGPGMTRGEDGNWHYTPAVTGAEGERTTFALRMTMNPSASPRQGEMIISSPDGSFLPVTIPVEQRGLTATFAVTPTHPDYLDASGETVTFSLYSPLGEWEVTSATSADWLSITPTRGDATIGGLATVTVSVDRNTLPRMREDVLLFRSGTEEIRINLSQMYDAALPDIPDQPVISTPWISEGWKPDYAILNACYLSPRYGVTACGARVREEGGTWREYGGEFIGDERIVVELIGLTPGTRYEAEPYILYRTDTGEETEYGASVTFTTPEYMPGYGDNPPPVVVP